MLPRGGRWAGPHLSARLWMSAGDGQLLQDPDQLKFTELGRQPLTTSDGGVATGVA